MGSGNKRKSDTGGGGGRAIAASKPATLYPKHSGQHGQNQRQAGPGGGGVRVGSSGGGSGNAPGSGSTSHSGSGASSGWSFSRSAAADEQGDGPRSSAEARTLVRRTGAAARDAQLACRGQRPLGAQVLGQAGIAVCSEVLAASLPANWLRRRLTKRIRRDSGLGRFGFRFRELLRIAPYFDTRLHSIRIKSRRCLSF